MSYNLTVRKWWVWLLGIHIPAALCAAAAPQAIALAQITSELRASLTAEYTLDIVVAPHEGDAWTRLAKRVTGDAERWKEIAAFNQAGDQLVAEQQVRVPFSLLRPELQRQIATTLFSGDRMEGRLKVTSRVYSTNSGQVTAEFVEGVLIRYTITSN